jgi:hypothetical protein
MTRVIVYKQMPSDKPKGPKGVKRTDPLVERGQFVCELEKGGERERQRFFGDSVERLARTVGLNVVDVSLEIQNGIRSLVRDVGGDQIDTKKLEPDEMMRFQGLLANAMKHVNLPGKPGGRENP